MQEDQGRMACHTFHTKLNELRRDEKFCDVKIRVQEEIFPCHRAVLVSASEYFGAMLSGSFKENRDQEIVLQDIDPKSFEDILKFIYTRKECTITPSNVNNLLYTASFLRIPEIERSCTNFILRNFSSIQDLLNTFRLVRASNITTLTDVLSEYIVKNFKSFYADDRFMEMPLDDLKFILEKWIHDELPFKQENLLLDLLIRWIQHVPKVRQKYFKEFIEVVNFERISPEYIEFTLKYFENVVEVSDAGNAPETNVTFKMNKNAANSELSAIEDSTNRLLLKEKIFNYFAANERVAGSNSEPAMIFPFQDPKFSKGELGLHVFLGYLAYSYNNRDARGSLVNERWKEGNVFSLTKYRPDWFLSSETDGWCRGKERLMSPQQSTDTIYCLETFQDPQDMSDCRQSFCTYSSIDMRLPSNALTPPPITASGCMGLYATRSDIFLLCSRDYYYSSEENFHPSMYHYNREIDKWFPVQERSGQRNCGRGIVFTGTADDNLVYLIDTDRGARILDHRIARWTLLPKSIRKHDLSHGLCTLNGDIYLGDCVRGETYDTKAGKWRPLRFPVFRNTNTDEYWANTFSIVKLVPFENMVWCIAKSSCIFPQFYNIASYNPVSEEWHISYDSLNEILPSYVDKLNAKNSKYSFDHHIQDVIVFKTQ